MENNYYTRIDNRLVMEMDKPNSRRFYQRVGGDLIFDEKEFDKALAKYNSRPSYSIKPSDYDKFKEGERYEKDVHFSVEIIPVEEWIPTYQNPDDPPTESIAFAINNKIDKETALLIYNRLGEPSTTIWDVREFIMNLINKPTAFALPKPDEGSGEDDCSQHKKEVAGISDMKALAEMIGDLHYGTLTELLSKLAEKISMDGHKDEAAGREKLADQLYTIAGYLTKATVHANWAWQISKPFMNH